MKITIREDESKARNIRIPTRLIVNWLTVAILVRYINKEQKDKSHKIKYSQAMKFAKELHRQRKRLKGDWKFLDVVASSGEKVQIVL